MIRIVKVSKQYRKNNDLRINNNNHHNNNLVNMILLIKK